MNAGDLGARENVLLGLRIGLTIATGFSVWVVILRLMFGPGVFDRFGVRWGVIVTVYYAALSLGGCAYGALLPLKRSPLGAMLLGFLLLCPMYLGIAVVLGLTQHRVPSLSAALVDGLVLGGVGGSILGLWIWFDERNQSRDGQGPPNR